MVYHRFPQMQICPNALKNQAMKKKDETEQRLHTFLTTTRDGGERSAARSGRFTRADVNPGTL